MIFYRMNKETNTSKPFASKQAIVNQMRKDLGKKEASLPNIMLDLIFNNSQYIQNSEIAWCTEQVYIDECAHKFNFSINL